MLVVRVLKPQNDYTNEVENLVEKINIKFAKTNKADAWSKYFYSQF